MRVELERSFPLPADVPTAWSFLQQIEAVAACMPGATITDRTDERHFTGTVNVRVGPVAMAFRGEIEVAELDPAGHRLRLRGKGADSSGTSGASLDLTASVEPGETVSASVLVGKSEVTINGKAAAFGGRMMGGVTDQILKQFAQNFAAALSARAAPANTAAVTPEEPAGPDENPASIPSSARTAPAAKEPPKELNALTLLWSMAWDWLRSLFRRKRPAS